MRTVTLPIEILRTRPQAVFWTATLLQALLWLLVPSLFYSAPPGDLADVISVGREMKFGSELGPPLAFWLADIALRAAGGHMAGVYLLSQLCIVAAYFAVFQLGRATLGERHSVLAVLLMAGISFFTIGSPDFGPDILMMPLWAFAVLHLWRAAGEDKELYWLALAVDFWLMLLTSHLSLLLLAVIVAFVIANPRARKAASNAAAGMAAVTIGCMILPSVVIIQQYGFGLAPSLEKLRSFEAIDQNIVAWVKLIALVAIAHAGAGILVSEPEFTPSRVAFSSIHSRSRRCCSSPSSPWCPATPVFRASPRFWCCRVSPSSHSPATSSCCTINGF